MTRSRTSVGGTRDASHRFMRTRAPIVVITGATAGVGRATARRFAR
ncbi:MAG: SDR family NAD(P)-dependent oxidoreductase, partial [Kofleriaceae bacterium]